MNKTQLENQKRKIDQELQEIENKEWEKKELPRLKAMVGKCFIYRGNSYGSNSGTWNVYKKVLDYQLDTDGSLYFIYEEFATDCYGKCEISVNYHYAYTHRNWWGCVPFSGYEELKQSEYDSAFRKFKKEMETQAKLRKYLSKK